MTARPITARWKRVRQVLDGRIEQWMRLLLIADAGERGMQIHEIALHCIATPKGIREALARLVKAGLLTLSTTPNPNGGHARNLYHITPKGLDFLGVEPSNSAPLE